MKYFVYFDAYGHARQFINEQQLAESYGDQPDEFLIHEKTANRKNGIPVSSHSA